MSTEDQHYKLDDSCLRFRGGIMFVKAFCLGSANQLTEALS